MEQRAQRPISAAGLRAKIEDEDGGSQRWTDLDVRGVLDLSGVTLLHELRFERCRFDDGIRANDLVGESVELSDTEVASFEADGLQLRKDLSFRACRLGPVTVRRARIGQDVVLAGDGGGAPGTHCTKLNVSTSHIGGSLRAEGLQCPGGLRAERTVVVGVAELAGALLGSPECDVSLLADDASFGEFLAAPDGTGSSFSAQGTLRLVRAKIAGAWDLRAARLEVASDDSFALLADGVTCETLLCDGVGGIDEAWRFFDVRGPVRLARAEVRGRLGLRGARFDGCGEPALDLTGSSVGRIDAAGVGGVNTTIRGLVDLSHCRVNGEVALNGVQVEAEDGAALDCSSAEIADGLWLCGARLTGRRSGERGGIAVLGRRLVVGDLVASTRFDGSRFEADGTVSLAQAQVGDRIDLVGAHLSTEGEGPALIIDEVRAKRVLLNSAVVKGEVKAVRAEVTAAFVLSGAEIMASPAGQALDAGIGRFGVVNLRLDRGQPFRARGTVSFAGSHLTDGLLLNGARITASPDRIALDLQRLKAIGLTASSAADRTTIVGSIYARGMVVDADVDLSGIHVHATNRSAIVLTDATAEAVLGGPDPQGRRLVCDGGINVVRGRVRGEVDLSGAKITAAQGVAVDLATAEIGALLATAVPGLTFEARGGVSLARATVDHHVDLDGAWLTAAESPPNVEVPERCALYADGLRAASLTAAEIRYDDEPAARRFVAEGTVRLAGAVIGGELQLVEARIEAFDGRAAVILDGAEIGEIFAGTGSGLGLRATGRVSLVGARIAGDVTLSGAVIRAPYDALRLSGASIGRTLAIDGVSLRSTEGGAGLRADRCDVGELHAAPLGDAPATEISGVHSGLELLDARVHGELHLCGSRIVAERGAALILREAKVGTLRLDDTELRASESAGAALLGDRLVANRVWAVTGLVCRGALDLREARVEDRIDIAGARIDGVNPRRVAFNLSRASCPTVNLGTSDDRVRTTIVGELRAVDARISGELRFRGVRVLGRSDGESLVLDRAEMGDLRLQRDWTGNATDLVGRMVLRRAKVTGQVAVSGGILRRSPAGGADALDVSATRIGELRLDPVAVHGRVVLLGTRAARLVTAWRSDAVPSGLDLGGLRYDRWDTTGRDEEQERGWQLAIVRRLTDPDAERFPDPVGHVRSPDPFEQLAGVLRSEGDERTARRALAEREGVVTRQRVVRDRGQAFPRRWGYRAWRAAYRLMVGYGYREWQAVISLLVLLVVAFGLTSMAADHGRVELRGAVPEEPAAVVTTVRPPGSGTTASGTERDQVEFDRVVYALERVLPAVDLGERSRIRVTGALGWALGLCSLLGWILVIALIAAVTKTLRRD